jgi:hypothetical protein
VLSRGGGFEDLFPFNDENSWAQRYGFSRNGGYWSVTRIPA